MPDTSFLEKLSLHARHCLKEARDIARYTKSETIEPRHLLLSAFLENGSLGRFLLENIGFEKEKLGKLCLKREKSKKLPGDFVPALSRSVSTILRDAYHLANDRAFPYVGTEHFVSALLSSKNEEIRLITATLGINTEKIASAIDNHLNFDRFPDFPNPFESSEATMPKTASKKKSRISALEQYTIETKDHDKGILVGREPELDRLAIILSRRTKNNPLLIGDPGVGKTALVTALAERISQGNVPTALLGKRILTLDLALIVAGTNFRGEFESRLKDIIDEARENPDIILFIDEIHTLVGAGNATGSLDAANILKPALSRGEIRCIGATTLTEFKRHIEKDPALERRFQSIVIREPDIDETIDILSAAKSLYEEYHRVSLAPDIISLATQLASRSLPDRFFPDKAFDILDEASAKAAAESCPRPRTKARLPSLIQEHAAAQSMKDELVKAGKFDAAFVWHKEEQLLNDRIQKHLAREAVARPVPLTPVTEKHIFTAVSHMTGIPAEKLSGRTPSQKLVSLKKVLKEELIGQPQISKAVADALARTLSGIHHPGRPLGSFFLLGPTGVGKTHLANILAREFFGNKKSLIRIDMSEFMEKHSVAQMIGAPAGYVGYGEGGKLTERVRRNPFSLVLFDEVEKAHPDVLNILLQILDEGTLTDAEGRSISFKNTLILITSNIGTAAFTEASAIGFGKHLDTGDTTDRFASIEHAVLTELKKTLRPELLARIGSTLVFRPLDAAAIEAITKLELQELQKRLRAKNINLSWDDDILKFLGKKSFSPEHGARLIRKNIEMLVEYPLSETLIRNPKKKNLGLSVRHDAIVCAV